MKTTHLDIAKAKVILAACHTVDENTKTLDSFTEAFRGLENAVKEYREEAGKRAPRN